MHETKVRWQGISNSKCKEQVPVTRTVPCGASQNKKSFKPTCLRGAHKVIANGHWKQHMMANGRKTHRVILVVISLTNSECCRCASAYAWLFTCIRRANRSLMCRKLWVIVSILYITSIHTHTHTATYIWYYIFNFKYIHMSICNADLWWQLEITSQHFQYDFTVYRVARVWRSSCWNWKTKYTKI